MGLVSLGELWPRTNGERAHQATVPDPPQESPPDLCAKTGKIRHKTFGDALKAKTSLYKMSPEWVLNIYRCKHGCRDYHVGRL